MTHPTEVKLPESLEAIRAALAAGPTPGPWTLSVGDDYTIEAESLPSKWPHTPCFKADSRGPYVAHIGNHQSDFGRADADYIAACNPQAITALLSALKARDAEIERLRGVLSAILSDSLDADSETNVPPALYAQGVAAIDQARAEGGEKTK